MLPVTIAIIAYESLSVTEEAKHGRVVDRDAGQGERHALKESCDLKKSREGSKKVSTTCEKTYICTGKSRKSVEGTVKNCK